MIIAPKSRGFTLTEAAIVTGIAGLILAAVWLTASYSIQSRRVNQAINETRSIVDRFQALAAVDSNIFRVGADGGCAPSAKTACTALTPAQRTQSTSWGVCTSPPNTPGGAFNSAGSFYWEAGVVVNNALTNASGVAMGIFPREMISGTASAPVISSPWGQQDIVLTVYAGSSNCTANGLEPTSNSAITKPPGAGQVFDYGSFILNYKSIPQSACEQMLLSAGPEFAQLGLSQLWIGTAYGFNNYGLPVPPPGANITTSNVATALSASAVSAFCAHPGTPDVSLAMYFPYQHP